MRAYVDVKIWEEQEGGDGVCEEADERVESHVDDRDDAQIVNTERTLSVGER
jgi:hypothetical protein